MGRNDIKAARAALESATGGLPDTKARLVQLLVLDQDHERALREIEMALRDRPGDSRLRVAKAMIATARGDLGEAHLQYETAAQFFPRALESRPDDPELLARLAPIKAALGQRADALKAARRATELVPLAQDKVDGPEYETALALTYSILNEPEAALAILERLAPLPCAPLAGELLRDPRWENLRGDPRFSRIVEQVRAPVSD